MSDSAANCIKAKKLLLADEGICDVMNFVLNNTRVHAKLYGLGESELKLPGNTRFKSVFIMMSVACAHHSFMQQLV